MKLAGVTPARRALPVEPGRRLAGFFLLLLLFAARAAFALDITTSEGKTYRQCEIVKVEPDALRIAHADGVARLPYEKLPADLQKKYFDPDKVAAIRAEQEAARKAAEAKAEEARRLQAEAAARAEEARLEQALEEDRLEAERKAAAQAEENRRHEVREMKAKVVGALLIAGAVVGLFIYFLPTLIARHKANVLAIFVFNLFLGWTFLGWVVALVWACTRDSAMDVLAQQQLDNQPRGRPFPVGGPYNESQLPTGERFRDAQILEQERLADGEKPRDARRLRDRGRYLE